MRPILWAIAALSVNSLAAQTPQQGDFTVANFRFTNGQQLPKLNLHYTTLGQPARDSAGHVMNAVLILHGTGGSGAQFLSPQFHDVLFQPGQLLDAAKYFIILPDDIGHGKSSKPSDGMRAHFPEYGYGDMVTAEHRLVTEGLHVDHLRLVIGTSMGCMHAWMWGEQFPADMDGLMPLACQTVPIAGRNRIWRKMVIDAIRSDPEWMHGDYAHEPPSITTVNDLLIIAGSAPLYLQNIAPTPQQADDYLAKQIELRNRTLDANDVLYAVSSSRDYDPSEDLEKIQAYVMYINSADDFINPPELGIAQHEITRVKHGRYVLLPVSEETRGHGTHTRAIVWKQYLAELLQESAQRVDAK
jgi:homoserine O-acetyltransferase